MIRLISRRFAAFGLVSSLLGILMGCDSETDPNPDVSSQGTQDEGALADFYRGISAMEQFQYKDSADAFAKVLAAQPTWVAARINHGIALMNQAKPEAYDKAIEEFGRAIEEAPQSPHAHYSLGIVLKQVGRMEEARDAFRKVEAIDPEDARTQLLLGQLEKDLVGGEAAKPFLERALQLDPYLEAAYYQLMQIEFRAKNRDRGEEHREQFELLKDASEEMLASTVHEIKYTGMGRYADLIRTIDSEGEGGAPIPPIEVRLVDFTEKAGLPAAAGSSKTWPLEAGSRDELLRAVAGVFGASVSTGDLNRDGADEIVVVLEGDGGRSVALFVNDGKGTFTNKTQDAGWPQSGVDVGAALGDYDSDGDVDVFIARAGPDALLRNDGELKFQDVTAELGLDGGDQVSATASFADADHDGDLDLFVGAVGTIAADYSGGSYALSDLEPAANHLFNNNGDGSFTEVAEKGGLDQPGSRTVGVLFTDVDADIDRDIILFNADSPNQLFINDRIGRYHEVSAGDLVKDIRGEGGGSGGASGDLNRDGNLDHIICFGEATPSRILHGSGGQRLDAGDQKLPGARNGRFLDLDNDGDLDLLLGRESSPGLSVHVNDGRGQLKDASADYELSAVGDFSAGAIATSDLDLDGDLDVVCAGTGGSAKVLLNQGGNKNNWLAIRLDGIGVTGEQPVSPRGSGTIVEVRAGPVWQRIDAQGTHGGFSQSSATVHFGLGQQSKAEYVRMVWPDGVVQSEPELSAGQVHVLPKVQRKLSSCPTLFTWDGQRFRFITDFMGGGGLGYFMEEGVYGPPDPTEVVHINPDDLIERDGKLLMRVAEPMEEISYIDQLTLVAIDHPASVQVRPDERFWTGGGPEPTGETVAMDRFLKPIRATDIDGKDLSDLLAKADRLYPPIEKRRGHLGKAQEHAIDLTFDLDEIDPDCRLILGLEGWVEYGYSHDNYAAKQAGVASDPPTLEIPDGADGWTIVYEHVGYPAGMPKTMTLDVTEPLRKSGGRVRMRTNLEVYWDAVWLGCRVEEDVFEEHTVALESAELRFLGYPREFSPDGQHPLIYDYALIDQTLGFRSMSGLYTRYGDVAELIESVDDAYVIMGKGEEIALVYDASSLPELREGWVRSYALRTDGFCKDMDLYTAHSKTVDPLPFHAMTEYPYPQSESYPDTEATRRSQELYNTRLIHGR